MSADFVFSYFFSSGTAVVPDVVEIVLPLRSARDLMPEALLHRGRDVDHEVGRSEGHLLLPLDAIGRRATFHVDIAGLQLRNAVARRDRLQVDLEIGHLELGLHRVDDLHAEVHRVADRLLLVVEVGKRDRRFAVAERNRSRFLDLLERPGQLLRLDGKRDGSDNNRHSGLDGEIHGGFSPKEAAKVAMDISAALATDGHSRAPVASCVVYRRHREFVHAAPRNWCGQHT